MNVKKVIVPLLLGAAASLCAGGSPAMSSASSSYHSVSSSSSGEVSQFSQRDYQLKRLRRGANMHRSASAPGELGMIVEVPGSVPSFRQKRQPKFLTPSPSPCQTVYVDELKEEIDTARKELTTFKDGLLEGNGRSHSFEVTDETVSGVWKAFRHFSCFVGQVKQCQQLCIQKKGSMPLCCSDQKIFDDAEKETNHAKEDFNFLAENRPGAPRKILRTVVAKIEAELADLDKLDIYLDELQRRSTCCQQQLARKSWREKFFGCWPKKGASKEVTPFDSEIICEND